jgi:uncharacterized MAPEG superfamily protein
VKREHGPFARAGAPCYRHPMDRLPYVMLVLTLALAYAPKLVVAAAMNRQLGKYDNALPRASYGELKGLGARAVGAHLNGLEAFSGFAAGVLACEVAGVNAACLTALACAFVVLRALYLWLYLADLPTARSAVWGLGFLVTLTLLALPVLR